MIPCIKEENGNVTTIQNRILERCKEYYEKLYQSGIGKPLPQPKSAEDKIPLITASEVRHAIRQLKENKAPGSDNITNDLLKNTGEVLLAKRAELFSECLHQSKIPKDWHTAAISYSIKKGIKRI